MNSGNRGKSRGCIFRIGPRWDVSEIFWHQRGVHLRNVCYLGLDDNKLDGVVPEAVGALKFVRELNLESESPISLTFCV